MASVVLRRVGDCARNSASRARSCVDLLVAAQAFQGGAQLVAAALQFAAPLVNAPCGSKVGDVGGCQGRSQFFLCCNVFGLNIECGRAGGDTGGHDTDNLDLGGAGDGGRPALAGGQRHPLVTDGELDVGGGGQFHRRRDQRQLVARAIDCGRGLFDSLQQLLGEGDSGQLRADPVAVALDGVDLGQPVAPRSEPSTVRRATSTRRWAAARTSVASSTAASAASASARAADCASTASCASASAAAIVVARVSISVYQPQPPGVGGGRRGVGRGRGVSDQLGFARLPGECGDLVGGGLGDGEPGAGGEPQLRQLGHLLGEDGVATHPVVDLGDRRRALRHRRLGVGQPGDRGRPLPRRHVRSR